MNLKLILLDIVHKHKTARSNSSLTGIVMTSFPKLAICYFLFLLTGSLYATPPVKKKQPKRPNILIIQMDDVGFDDLSINGNTVAKTPNIDKLAKASVQFENFYVANVCAPTRASLLTGRDYWRTGVTGVHGGNDFLNLNETTFADLIHQNGYTTGMWGKWHTGKAEGYWPWQRGFDEAFYAKLYKHYPSQGWLNDEKVKYETWSDEQLVDMAIAFMKKNKNKPFLAYLSSLSTHGKWAAPEDLVQKYMTDGRTKDFATLLAMQEFADQQIGRLLKFLETSGLDEKTVVIFMSDNGPIPQKESPEEWALRNNHEYIGTKARNWKNGIKSPLYVQYKGHYAPANVELMCSITDIFPTLLELTSTQLPDSNLPLDGRSMVGCFEGKTEEVMPKQAFFTNRYPIREEENEYAPYAKDEKYDYDFFRQRITLIRDDYKLSLNPIASPNSPKPVNHLVLIDHKNDLLERTNIVKDHPEVVQSMLASMKVWFKSIIEDQNTFQEKISFIGHPSTDKKQTILRSVLMDRSEGFENHSHHVKFPENGKGHIDYNVLVQHEGEYTLKLVISKQKIDTPFTLTFTANGKEYPYHFNGKATHLTKKITLKKGFQSVRVSMDEDTSDLKGVFFKDLLFNLKKSI
ncbi:sulfatase-like hydrolase/transferase [Flammeovirga sp. EKP202]|uniref:sulfatase-like hydrolase/transferase n=1 Tax=Flammeovirga sp. EKP202 TaxID=2770592 RepID=UPI0016600181|nr:sulfatase-like hydrolase/transferase [Flammeovirga sp. EKP202]MBD0405356.1 sulfatase-like hydrolase/transferase [Flammeovirga sp. EKP202]